MLRWIQNENQLDVHMYTIFCRLGLIFEHHKERAQGGPRGGPLAVPPLLGKTFANQMQSTRHTTNIYFYVLLCN